MEPILEQIVAKYNYWAYIVLMMIGLFGIIAKKNLIKKIIGMSIFQTAVILFFISTSVKWGGDIPIVPHGHEGQAAHTAAAIYNNPLPQVLMLTAIVVAVGTLGVALALAIRVYQRYQTLSEDEILIKLRRND